MVTKHRFTVDEYHKMGEAGIFGEDDRVELVGGEVVEMTPIGGRHLWVVNRLTDVLADFRGMGSFVISVQNPIVLGEHEEYQPDLALLRRDAPGERVPRAEDTLLVVEVADTSLQYDREQKLPRYARAGIPEVWISNVSEKVMEIYADPGPSGYRSVARVRGGEDVVSVTVEGLSFPARAVFG